MKRLLISLAACSALGLTGCDDETLSDAQRAAEDRPEVTKASSRVLFDPGADDPVVQVPNDLLYQGTTDGTLNIPVDDPSNSFDPFFAISTLDGWSVDHPFTVEIGVDEEVEIDPASVSQPGSVRIYETIYGGPLAPPECAEVPAGFACQVVAELEFGVDFMTTLSGNSIVVIPLKPLKPKTGYLLTTTEQLMDSLNRTVKGSETYELVKQDVETHPVSGDPNAATVGLQRIINSYENAVEAFGVDPTPINYSAAFTTQSTYDALATNRLSMIENVETTPALSMPTALGISAREALMARGITDEGTLQVASTALLYSASLSNVPYYLEYPFVDFVDGSATNCDLTELATTGECDAINSWWKAAGDSPVTILGAVQAGVLTPEMVMQACPSADLTNATTLVGCQIPVGADADGNPIYLDPERNLTKYNPLAAPTELRTLDVFVTLPDTSAQANGIRTALGLPTIEAAPATGWPVAIFSHGISRAKEDAVALVGTMALNGIAVIAIDHPLHGSRSWDVQCDAGACDGIYELSASSGLIDTSNPDDPYQNANFLLFGKVNHVLTARDNFRQSVNDHLALRMGVNALAMGLAGAGAPQVLDASNVHMTGQSLGGITTASTAAVAGMPLIDPRTGEEITQVSYKFATAGMNVPGQGLAGVFAYSDAFGPILEVTILSQLSGQTAEELGLLQATDPAAYEQLKVDVGYAVALNQFVFALQTVADPGDPVAYTDMLGQQSTPLLLQEVIDDGTIPNSNAAFGLPLSGTEPMIGVMQLPAVDSTVMGDAEMPTVNGAVRFVDSSHGSLLDPTANPAATQEMQTQLAAYLASRGAVILVSNPDVVAPAE